MIIDINMQLGSQNSVSDIDDIEDMIKLKPQRLILDDLLALPDSEWTKAALNNLKRKHRAHIKDSLILSEYNKLVDIGKMEFNPKVGNALKIKRLKSNSGVIVVTVMLSDKPNGQNFTCQWNCYYCPNQKGYARSYLAKEPAVQRGNRCGFDPVVQMYDRLDCLKRIGHKLDKLELIVLGGTWESYPEDYRTEFVRDLFYAANTYNDRIDTMGSHYYQDGRSYKPTTESELVSSDLVKKYDMTGMRERRSILEEQKINEDTALSIIGLTLETRPDTVTPESIRALRRLGCTRVQIGVQHTDDRILANVNRQSTLIDTIRAIGLLKEACFKIDIHLMPDLPGATPEIDLKMFKQIVNDHRLQADQMKIYPTAVTDFTIIKRWYEQGQYKPYAERDNGKHLISVLQWFRKNIHPWIRFNRIIRDIPTEYIHGGNKVTHLRDVLMKAGESCDIRYHEIRDNKVINPVLERYWYLGSGCSEVWLTYSSYQPHPNGNKNFRYCCGFLRLRLPNSRLTSMISPELYDHALIRELHVYGSMNPKSTTGSNSQHSGFGKSLMADAERIAMSYGYQGIAVISGVGVRNYYRKLGYNFSYDSGQYGLKKLSMKLKLDWKLMFYDGVLWSKSISKRQMIEQSHVINSIMKLFIILLVIVRVVVLAIQLLWF